MMWLDRLQAQYRLYNDPDDYPTIRVIPDFVPDSQLINLQNRCDAFVMPSRGESTCRPLLESYYLGKFIIATHAAGCLDYQMMRDDRVFDVDADIVPCRSPIAPMEGIYSSWETWREISIFQDIICYRA